MGGDCPCLFTILEQCALLEMAAPLGRAVDDARLVDQQTASRRSAISVAGKAVQYPFRAGGDGHAESRAPVARTTGQGRSVKCTVVQNKIGGWVSSILSSSKDVQHFLTARARGRAYREQHPLATAVALNVGIT